MFLLYFSGIYWDLLLFMVCSVLRVLCLDAV